VFIQKRAEVATEIPRRLITVASQLFARHGYAATRVREIVRVADVDLSAVTYYFGGKEGLYAATLQELVGPPPAEPAPPVVGEVAEEALYRQVLGLLRRFASEGSPLGAILAHESMNPTESFDFLVRDVWRPELERLAAIVKRLAGEGVDDRAIARIAMSVMGQCLFYLFARGAIDRIYPQVQRKDHEALARHITGFSLMGIAVHTSRNPDS
jgi:TetR/AcrR family transcriptional regulator, regulator of cefoperazone and chloramphenicol sensitivity